MGSRSTVIDPISMLVGPREFPLYSKGQDRKRFEFGVFLMNKNIEQLLHSQGLQFLDLRQTLPNIRYLSEVLLTSSPAYKARQRQDDKLYHRYSLEGSLATETDDELGAPALRVQGPDENLSKPQIDFDASRTPSSTTDTSLSAKTSESQSFSQLRHQLDAVDNEGYDFVEEAAELGPAEDEDWQAPQSSSRFFSGKASSMEDTMGEASRLHRASTDFALLKGHQRLRVGGDEEEDATLPPRQRRTTWDLDDARPSASHASLRDDRLAEQDAALLGQGERGDRSERCGQGSDSSESTAHENTHLHQTSLSNLTPALSSKTMSSGLSTGFDATQSANT
ncbi:hypothetical protein DFQ26_004199 [Actinomortierella ambigua]|nr:hypothetical protein DFQ26_004199 [Actinomortierella ambigua]